MSSIINSINRAVCLTLDKRINLYDSIKDQASKYNIKTEIFLCGDGSLDLKYDHIDIKELPPVYDKSIRYDHWYTINAYNAWLCHRKIMQKAYEDGCENLLMLEDDIEFEEDFDEVLSKAEPFILC